MRRVLAVAIAGAMIAFAAPASAQTRISIATGVDFSSGDYGQEMDTEVVAVPFTVRFTHEDWSVRASVPYLQITGPADVADIEECGGGGDGESGGGEGGGAAITRAGTERGLGDVTLALTRSFRRLGGTRGYFDATARVRLPTGDEDRGLGVGATDITLGGELGVSERQGGAYVTLARRFLGERDDGPERVDGWQAGVGAWRHLGERTTVGVSAYWREASHPRLQNPAELGANASYRLSPNWRISAHVSGGLSDASPTTTSGLRLTWRSPRRD